MCVWALYCHFILALCNAALTRGEDEAALSQGFDAAVFRHVDVFDEGLEEASDEWRRRRLHRPPRPVMELMGGGIDEDDEPVRLDGLLEDVLRRLPTLEGTKLQKNTGFLSIHRRHSSIADIVA